jgi:hypothetical protein
VLLAVPKQREKASYLRGWEHRREKDEAVEVNLSPEEAALWRRMKGRFKGTPHERMTKFRHWLHDHPGELERETGRRSESRVVDLVRRRESAAAVAVPCRDPFRFRTKAACRGTKPQPKWTRSSLLRAGRSVEVPCAAERPRVKELGQPRERRWVPPPEEPVHAFEGLL